jgi:hypothetical protein
VPDGGNICDNEAEECRSRGTGGVLDARAAAYLSRVTPSVLVVGLDPHRVPGPWDPEPIASAIAAAVQRCVAADLDAVTCLIGVDGSDDIASVVSAALASRPWDCVVVGGGLRGDEELLADFELVVNLAHRLAPQASIGFNRHPDDLLETVHRALALRG